MDFYQSEFETPVGMMYVVSDGKNLRVIDYTAERLQRMLDRYYPDCTVHVAQSPDKSVARLKDYFAGDLRAVDKLTVASNGTEFQTLVWAALRKIPAGETISYSTLARRIGRPNACRAVGLANGSNPINIVVPCHRVVGADRSLTGYGGGLSRKQWLLEHEAGNSAAPLFAGLKEQAV